MKIRGPYANLVKITGMHSAKKQISFYEMTGNQTSQELACAAFRTQIGLRYLISTTKLTLLFVFCNWNR